MCRLEELSRQEHVPLYLYFIDLQDAYHSVDNSVLREVLARYSVLVKMIRSSTRSATALRRVCTLTAAKLLSGLMLIMASAEAS